MASDPERHPAEDTVVVDADRLAARDEDWPVTDLYRVEPETNVLGEFPEDETLDLSAPNAPLPPRRALPGIGVPLLAIVLAAGAVVLAAILLAARDDGQPARAAEKRVATPGIPSTGKATTTPVTSSSAPLPNLEGMRVADARRLLHDLHLRARVAVARSERDRGLVLRQDPAQGAKAPRGEVVTLVVASGKPSGVASVTVPSVVGLSASDAVVAVRDAGLVARIRLVAVKEHAGLVVRQSPLGDAAAKRASTIRLDVAKARTGPPPIEVPDIVGLDVADARARLRGLGLRVDLTRLASPEAAGTVIRQRPRASARLPRNGRVTLTVSSGSQTVDVPDVTGLDEQSARAELEGAGFDVTVTYEPTSDPAEDGLVQRQTPVGGTTAAEGSGITIVVAQQA